MDRLALINQFAKLAGEEKAAGISLSKREALPQKDFAIPAPKAKKLGVEGEIKGESKGKYPIDTKNRAENALGRVSQKGTPGERQAVRSKVYSKFPDLKESFEKEHGESPTAKGNVKKQEQGGIGKAAEASFLSELSAIFDRA
jgi:hypothetical protein